MMLTFSVAADGGGGRPLSADGGGGRPLLADRAWQLPLLEDPHNKEHPTETEQDAVVRQTPRPLVFGSLERLLQRGSSSAKGAGDTSLVLERASREPATTSLDATSKPAVPGSLRGNNERAASLWRDAAKQFNPPICSDAKCDWTSEWSCPNSETQGTQGVATRKENDHNFYCCCEKEVTDELDAEIERCKSIPILSTTCIKRVSDKISLPQKYWEVQKAEDPERKATKLADLARTFGETLSEDCAPQPLKFKEFTPGPNGCMLFFGGATDDSRVLFKLWKKDGSGDEGCTGHPVKVYFDNQPDQIVYPANLTKMRQQCFELNAQFCSDAKCDWTSEWSCPGSDHPGTKGWASPDETKNFYCCCEKEVTDPEQFEHFHVVEDGWKCETKFITSDLANAGKRRGECAVDAAVPMTGAPPVETCVSYNYFVEFDSKEVGDNLIPKAVGKTQGQKFVDDLNNIVKAIVCDVADRRVGKCSVDGKNYDDQSGAKMWQGIVLGIAAEVANGATHYNVVDEVDKVHGTADQAIAIHDQFNDQGDPVSELLDPQGGRPKVHVELNPSNVAGHASGPTAAFGTSFTENLPASAQQDSEVIMGAVTCLAGLASTAATAGVAAVEFNTVIMASCSNIVGHIIVGLIGEFIGAFAHESPHRDVARPPKYVADLKWTKGYIEEIRVVMQDALRSEGDSFEELLRRGSAKVVEKSNNEPKGRLQMDDIPTSAITSTTINQAACMLTAMQKHASQIHTGTNDQRKRLEAIEDRAHEQLLDMDHKLNQALNIEEIKLEQDNRALNKRELVLLEDNNRLLKALVGGRASGASSSGFLAELKLPW